MVREPIRNLVVLGWFVLGGCASEPREQEPVATAGTANIGSTGASAGTEGDEDGSGSTGGDEGPAAASDPAQKCEAFVERCGGRLPALCHQMDDGLQVPESCAAVANEYLECLDQLSCMELGEQHFGCPDEFEAAHEACPSVFGFCRDRFASLDKEQSDPELCESLSLGCIDGSDYTLFCEPEGGTTSCFCVVDSEIVGTFDKPADAPANFCQGQEADDMAVEVCGWSSGIVPPAPEG